MIDEQTLGQANQAVFDDPKVIRGYAAADGWVDDGERAMILHAAARGRNGRVLDIGVGGGRTTGLLRLLTDDYVGVDYSPRMVAACRARFPGVDIRLGDARDLHEFPDASVDLVVMTFNALDAVGHEDRARVLAELARVVNNDGAVCVNTLNKLGPSYGETAFEWHRPGQAPELSLRRAAFFCWENVVHPAHPFRAHRNLTHNRRFAEDHGDWALHPLRSHEFSALVHFTTLQGFRDDIAAAGLEVEAMFTNEGAPIPVSASTSTSDNFNAVLKRR